MGAFDRLFGRLRRRREISSYFRLLDGYTPVFSTFDGGVYEMELTRSCIHAFANHASKLVPHVTGSDLRGIQRLLDNKPNPFMTSAQFLYKCATIYDAQNTVFIVPILDEYDRLSGYYPVNPRLTEVVDLQGEPWLRFTFSSGETLAVELARVGTVSKYLYSSDIVGESNTALDSTLQLLHRMDEGMAEGVKNSASFRFMATLNNFAKEEDVARKRKKFVQENFGPDAGGLALFPNYMSGVQQITSTAKVVDPEQLRLIQDRAYTYFGASEDIVQNKFTADRWSAYYEGKIEPFAIQLSQAMTAMTFTPLEIARRKGVTWSANRLQYMSNADKLAVTTGLFDRGLLGTDDANDIWNMPHGPGGNRRYIRKEYLEILGPDRALEAPQEEEEDDDPEEQGQV